MHHLSLFFIGHRKVRRLRRKEGGTFCPFGKRQN
jgi:hypothetical protein